MLIKLILPTLSTPRELYLTSVPHVASLFTTTCNTMCAVCVCVYENGTPITCLIKLSIFFLAVINSYIFLYHIYMFFFFLETWLYLSHRVCILQHSLSHIFLIWPLFFFGFNLFFLAVSCVFLFFCRRNKARQYGGYLYAY